jgi:hypothetical protein
MNVYAADAALTSDGGVGFLVYGLLGDGALRLSEAARLVVRSRTLPGDRRRGRL